MPTLFGALATPVASVPIQLPVTVDPVERAVSDTPPPAELAMTLSGPIVTFGEVAATPAPPTGAAVVPSASRPMRLPTTLAPLPAESLKRVEEDRRCPTGHRTGCRWRCWCRWRRRPVPWATMPSVPPRAALPVGFDADPVLHDLVAAASVERDLVGAVTGDGVVLDTSTREVPDHTEMPAEPEPGAFVPSEKMPMRLPVTCSSLPVIGAGGLGGGGREELVPGVGERRPATVPATDTS